MTTTAPARRRLSPFDLMTRDGQTVDRLLDLALREAEQRLGYTLTVVQGCNKAAEGAGAAASAGTHDGLGVVDLLPWDWQRKVRVLRRVGFAAWYRPELWVAGRRVWGAHIHAVLIGHRRLAPAARRQVDAYLARRDGLAGNGPDTDPGWTDRARFTWRTGAGRITRARTAVQRARALLAEGIRGYPGVAAARKALRLAENALPDPERLPE